MHACLLLFSVVTTHTRLLSATRLLSRAAPFQRRAYQPSMGLADMVFKLVGMGEPGAPRAPGPPAGQSPAPLTSDAAPSWEKLHGLWSEQATEHERGFRQRLAAGTGDEACHLATIRLFDGTKADAEKVVLYRDTVRALGVADPLSLPASRRAAHHAPWPVSPFSTLRFLASQAAWCPYCEKTWLALEEKRVPYTVKKINMNCYGDKPDWFRKLNPSGGIPVASIDGQVGHAAYARGAACCARLAGSPAAWQPTLCLQRLRR
jgi:glutaredoxin